MLTAIGDSTMAGPKPRYLVIEGGDGDDEDLANSGGLKRGLGDAVAFVACNLQAVEVGIKALVVAGEQVQLDVRRPD